MRIFLLLGWADVEQAIAIKAARSRTKRAMIDFFNW